VNRCRSELRRQIRLERRADRTHSPLDPESPEQTAILGEEHRDVLAALSRLPHRQREASTHQFVSVAWYGVARSYTHTEQKAFNTCQAAAQAADAPLWSTSQTINQAWFNIISHAQASSKVTAALPALRACARRYGYPQGHYGMATKPINSFSDFAGWDAGSLDGAISRNASSSTIRSLTRHWTSVFVTCATPIVGIWQQILLNAQPGFLHQHAQQMARLDRLASRELVQQHD
jgi:hypothetical protein